MTADSPKTDQEPMPSGGGSYIRQPDGGLKPAPDKAAPTVKPAAKPAKPVKKEGT